MLKLPKLNYYVLKPSGVYCFEGKQELTASNARAFIPLEEISLSLGTAAELADAPLHCIRITDRRKVHILACRSKEIRDSWITAILTAVAERLVSEPASRRRRFGSTDSEVFCELPSQFTSPFWGNQEGQKQSRRSKWSRMSVPEAVLEKTIFSMRNKKKNLSKSVSLQDIHSLFDGAQKTTPTLRRKHSSNDLTRHFWSHSGKSTKNGDVGGDASKTQEEHVPRKVSGKKRWSIFGMASSLGFPTSLWDNSSERKQDYDTKQHEVYIDSSPLICDTKL